MMYALYDETAQISHVLMHKPGLECKVALEAEDPEMWLFNPNLKGVRSEEWLCQAQWEFAELVNLLQQQGVKVQLLADLLKKQTHQLKDTLEEALKGAVKQRIVRAETANDFWKYLEASPVEAALTGIKANFGDYEKLAEAGLSVLIPKPNAYFSQDPFAILGNCFVELKPATWQRSGEPALWRIALQPHQQGYVKLNNIAEGGDITVVNGTVMVGIGTRTTVEAAHELYSHVGKFGNVKGVVPIFKPDAFSPELGKTHSKLPYIHLDTIFMPLQNGNFIGNLDLMKQCQVLDFNGSQVNLTPLPEYLVKTSGKDDSKIVHVLPSEQYTLAANVLPANDTVISSGINVLTNTALAAAGYKVINFKSEALQGGSGSAHCMTNAANRVLVLANA